MLVIQKPILHTVSECGRMYPGQATAGKVLRLFLADLSKTSLTGICYYFTRTRVDVPITPEKIHEVPCECFWGFFTCDCICPFFLWHIFLMYKADNQEVKYSWLLLFSLIVRVLCVFECFKGFRIFCFRNEC